MVANSMKTQTEDLTEDETIGEIETVNENDLAKQFVQPGYTFKGLPLKPYTAGTDLLFSQIIDQNDSPQTIFLSFIFVHVRDRTEMIKLCWDKEKFRGAFLDWADSIGPITKEDHMTALNLFEEIRGWAKKSTVEIVPDPDFPEKKTKAKRQRTSPN